MEFSLFYFANDDAADAAPGRYEFILESARWADRNGFSRVWTPERHFHDFGGLSPNPAVLAAAIAGTTRSVGICSGSVVLPLHDPIRVAEEWAMVDNISGGRVGLGLACGWVPNDFVISDRQALFEQRKDVFAEGIDTLRDLWAGRPHYRSNPQGESLAVTTMPRPLQPELPIWITAAANPETFRQAGELGAGVLTHLLGQTLQGLADKIRIYRQAWEAAEHDGDPRVTLMLHTFVGDSDEEVREIVREPMRRYLASSLNLASAHIQSVPFIRGAQDISTGDLTPETVDQVLDASFEKYFHMASLMGSFEKCLDTVDEIDAIGVTEIACLVDFGVAPDIAMAALENLNVVRVLANPKPLAPARAAARADANHPAAQRRSA